MYICHWNFNSIPDNLQLTLDTLTNNNPFLIVTIGDFNEKTTNWYNNDTTSYEGLNTDAVTSQFGLQQLIYEPTHLTGNSSSCIDLIFSSHPNLAAESGVHSSLHSNCHHQIVFAKFNLNFFYPSSYEHEMWHCNKANTDLIRGSIHEFSWENRFSKMQTKRCIYLMKQLRIFFLTLYHTRESFVIIAIPHGSIAKLKVWSWKKILLKGSNSKITVIFRWFQSLQNFLTVRIGTSKQQFSNIE